MDVAGTNLDAVREHLLGLEGQQAAVAAALKLLDAAREHADDLARKNQALERKLQEVLRAQVGRRTEKVSSAQLQLTLDAAGDDPIIDEAADLDAPTDAGPDDDSNDAQADGHEEAAKRRPRRRPLPPEPPRVVHEHDVPVADRVCPECGEAMACIGHDVSEILRYVPGRFEVDQHRRAKYACRPCQSGVVTALAPAKVIDKGLPHASLVAHVLVSKYEDHLPLNRQATRFEREGIPLARSTLGGWVKHAARELAPLVERMWERVGPDAHLVQVDASGLKVLDRDEPGNIRKGTMWCYVVHESARRTVLFDYARAGDGASGPWKRLAGRDGFVQADAASVFDRLFNGKVANALEVGCWAHARRKFFGLHESDPRAARVLQLIGKLFKVERLADADGMSPERRRELRQERSAPLLERLFGMLARLHRREPPQSALGKAIAYALRHREALSRFLDDGRLPLTNNLDELQIRTLAIGRKNYLFAGSDEGAERSAVIYSLLRSCALAGVNPLAYLTDVLQRLADGWPQRRIDELLPDAYAQQAAK